MLATPFSYIRELAMEFPARANRDETKAFTLGRVRLGGRRRATTLHVGAKTNQTSRDLDVDLSFLPSKFH